MRSAASCVGPSAMAAGPEDALPQAGARSVGVSDGELTRNLGCASSPHHGRACGPRRALLRDAGNGMEILDVALAGGQTQLPGDVAFKLHDTPWLPARSAGRRPPRAWSERGRKPVSTAMDKQKAQPAPPAKSLSKMDRALKQRATPSLAGDTLSPGHRGCPRRGRCRVQQAGGRAGGRGKDSTPFTRGRWARWATRARWRGRARALGERHAEDRADRQRHHGAGQRRLKVGDGHCQGQHWRCAPRHPAQPQSHAPDAQGPARSAGQPCAAKRQPGGRGKRRALTLRAQRAGDG